MVSDLTEKLAEMVDPAIGQRIAIARRASERTPVPSKQPEAKGESPTPRRFISARALRDSLEDRPETREIDQFLSADRTYRQDGVLPKIEPRSAEEVEKALEG